MNGPLGNDIIEWITVVAGRYQSHPLGSSAAKPGIWGKETNEQVNANLNIHFGDKCS
jgi:hypothetical protein